MPHPTLLPSLLTVEHFEVVKGSDRCSQITAHKFFFCIIKTRTAANRTACPSWYEEYSFLTLCYIKKTAQ